MSTVISLFDYTGIMVEPWAKAGYACICVDIQHPATELPRFLEPGTIYKVNKDIWGIQRYALNWPRPAIVFGFPPCTDLASSGARWFKAKAKRDPNFQKRAIDLARRVECMGNWYGCPWFFENPVGRMSTLYRKPDHWFHPWQFADLCPDDNYTKKTAVWCGNGFTMPRGLQEPLGDPDDRIHKAALGPERANFRSATPRGFAEAVFRANSEVV